ncbi:MAG: winged helix-turn-helix domain-containing protein [Acidobacteria bacterium]|nr:winged helix-turn-helix domain-containing protein [Acidobacteriota bacterium]MCI0721649.1 winged helix-turn-helix domain-containing protein [Acidobacteriota bacterium]
MRSLSNKTYSFEGFILDLARGCLTRDGQEIRLRPKSFESLKYLIENRGRLITKDELVQAIWPDTFVTDDSLVQCVRDIRRALDDDSQHHIKTVPRRGYIFEAEVIENGSGTKGKLQTEHPMAVAQQAQPALESAEAPAHWLAVGRHLPVRTLWLSQIGKLWPWVAAAMVVAISGLVSWYFWPTSAPPVWRSVPLTSYPGFELNPALSPDGNQVAFSWNGARQDNFDIYLKLIGSNSHLQLTTNPAEDFSPAWSPDGRTIAFLRRLGGGRKELLLIPALGGPERKLTETLIADNDNSRKSALAWSPDGRWLAVSHREGEDPAEGLFLVSALTGEKQRLTRPPSFGGDSMPAFSPDGRTLAFTRLTGWSTREEVYLLSLSGDFKPAGEARQLKTDVRWAGRPVWTREGRHILYISWANPVLLEQRELRMTAVSGSGTSERITLPEGNISELSLSRHLVYTRRTHENDIWRAEIPPPGGRASQPQLLISSTRRDGMPRYSPDGKKIAFSSTRSGTQEIWVADADGSNPVQLTSFGGPLVGLSNWSPDGQRLVFHARPEGHSDLFTISAAGGAPKRLTMDPSDDSAPSYSHDGRWIYFASTRSGQSEVWKMPAEGGDATRMTSGGGGTPIESPDGQTLYYEHPVREKGIWKVPVQGGEALQVTGAYKNWFSYTVAADGIFYVPAADSRHQGLIQFLSFSTGQSRPVVVSDRPIGGPNISPDRRFLVFAQPAETGSDLMLIENFTVP